MPEAYADVLRSELDRIQLQIASATQTKLVRFCEELDRWNRRINLTGLSGVDLVRRLVVEPIWIGDHLQMTGTLVDIGSGNGSPAIPLALTCAFEKTHLVEARTRRSAFLRQMLTVLQVPGEVHRARFEDAIAELPAADWITLQAVHPTEALLAAMKRISKPNTAVAWITSTSTAWPQGLRIQTPFPATQVILLNASC